MNRRRRRVNTTEQPPQTEKPKLIDYIGEDPVKRLERNYAEAQKVIIALVEAAGGEVFVRDDIVRSVSQHEYELIVTEPDPLGRSRMFRTKRLTKVWP